VEEFRAGRPSAVVGKRRCPIFKEGLETIASTESHDVTAFLILVLEDAT